MNKLEIIAHRGFSSIAPENTIAAFTAAIEHQADSIEFDVQLSADGIPVIIHDTTLQRTTGITGKVKELNLAQLKQLDAGLWFDQKFAQETIPTLTETLSYLNQKLKQFIYAEVKYPEHWSDPDVDNFIQILIDTGWQNKSIVCSFDELFIDRISAANSNIRIGYAVDTKTEYLSRLAKAATRENTIMVSDYQVILEDPNLIELTRKQGVDIVVWTVDNIQDLERLTQLGITRIITNKLIN